MVVLGAKKLINLSQDPEIKLVENLSERELKGAEGAGLDFRIGSVFRLKRNENVRYFLGELERQTPHSEKVMEYKEGEKQKLVLKPGEYVLVGTMEKINTPMWLAPTIRPRTTMFRSGIHLLSADIGPGYCGPLTVGLHNASEHEFEIELGARILHVRFHRIEGGATEYQGQWQGGRVSTEEKEKQI